MNFKSNFLAEFYQRGFYDNCTHPHILDQILSNDNITAYIGFDCTADDLHIGSLIQIMIIRLLLKHQHKPIILLGQGTTKIGDPSGKDSSRKIINDEEITSNMLAIKQSISKFLSPFDSNSYQFVNNYDWLSNINYIDFLRDIGSRFSVNRMLNFDSVKLRIDREQNLSFLEFNYMILQAYDFYILNLKYNCSLQIGGSDQWGNIVNGVELTKKLQKDDKKNNVYGLTSPLITTSDGKKMGKTEKSAIWLNSQKLDPYDYFQYFRNVDDKDIKKFLLLFSDIEIEQIHQLCSKNGQELNKAKEILAFETTKICHGINNAETALQKARQIFTKQSTSTLEQTNITSKDNKIKLTQIIKDCQACESLNQAKKLILGNAVRLNDVIINDVNHDIASNCQFKLQIGKKKFYNIKLTLNKND